MKAAPFPPPYKGQNYQFPVIAIQSPYCERMLNFKNDLLAIKLRKGNSKFADVASNLVFNVEDYDSAVPKLFIMVLSGVNIRWKDITAGSLGINVHTIAFTSLPVVNTAFFNGYLFYFGTGDLSTALTGPQFYNGSVWGTAAYTWPAAFNPLAGVAHKNRLYAIKTGAAAYAYSGIDSISGAMTEVDMSGIVTSKSELFMIRSLSLTENTTQQNIAAFIFSNGEILIYEGSYPNSPSWAIVARFRISEIFYSGTFVDAKGDVFLFTNSEILSLRNLFSGGYDKEKAQGIGAAIQPRWQQIASALLTGSIDYRPYIKGVYDSAKDRFLITIPVYVNPVTGALEDNKIFQLIYDFRLGAWYEYLQQPVFQNLAISSCYFNNKTIVATQAGPFAGVAIEVEGSANFTDESLTGSSPNPIPFNLRTAPMAIPMFGANSIDGVEVLVKSDLYAQTNYKWISDLGRQETNAQPLPDQGATIARPMYNVGIQNVMVAQLDISGSTVEGKEVGIELYGFNAWYNSGDKGSR